MVNGKIFISYSRKDKEYVFGVRNIIERELNTICWIDLNGIESDQQFVDVIISAIKKNEIFIFMYSANSAVSKWTRKELHFADKHNKRIVFIKVDNSEFDDWFEFHYGEHDIIDFENPDQRKKLLKNLRNWLKEFEENKPTIDEAKIRAEIEAKLREEFSAKQKVNEESKDNQSKSRCVSRKIDDNIIVGIDFGTTNCRVAIFDDGKPKVIERFEGVSSMPSVVTFTEKNKAYYGAIAKRKAIENPRNSIFNIKRLLGERDLSPSNDLLHSSNIIRYHDGCPYIDIENIEYSPQEISALLFLKIKNVVEDYLGVGIRNVVVSVPACSTIRQRSAIEDAAKIAGLNVCLMFNDTTAALLAYMYTTPDKDARVAILNFGGGTFSFSTFETGGGVFEELATSGDMHIGGTDFTEVIATWLIDDFNCSNGINLSTDPVAVQRIRDAAEMAKIELSTSETTVINIPYICQSGGESLHVKKTLSRQKFQELSQDLLNAIIKSCQNVIPESGCTADEFDEVILVGGASNMPIVQTLVEQIFKRNISRRFIPEDSVVVGTAVNAAILMKLESVDDMVCLNAYTHSIGLKAARGAMEPIIKSNITIPCKYCQTFTTTTDNQTSISLNIFEGEDSIASNNIPLGKVDIEGIVPARKGVPQIEVAFDINANRVLNVFAKDKRANKELPVKMERLYSLSDENIRKMSFFVSMIEDNQHVQ